MDGPAQFAPIADRILIALVFTLEVHPPAEVAIDLLEAVNDLLQFDPVLGLEMGSRLGSTDTRIANYVERIEDHTGGECEAAANFGLFAPAIGNFVARHLSNGGGSLYFVVYVDRKKGVGVGIVHGIRRREISEDALLSIAAIFDARKLMHELVEEVVDLAFRLGAKVGGAEDNSLRVRVPVCQGQRGAKRIEGAGADIRRWILLHFDCLEIVSNLACIRHLLGRSKRAILLLMEEVDVQQFERIGVLGGIGGEGVSQVLGFPRPDFGAAYSVVNLLLLVL